MCVRWEPRSNWCSGIQQCWAGKRSKKGWIDIVYIKLFTLNVDTMWLRASFVKRRKMHFYLGARPQPPLHVHNGRIYHAWCDKKAADPHSYTLVQLRVKVVYLKLSSQRGCSILLSVGSYPWYFWDGLKGRKAWFTCSRLFYITIVVLTKRGSSPTPPCPDR